MANEDLFKKINLLLNSGYNCNGGDLIETFLYAILTNSLISAEILKKQYELEQLVKHGVVVDGDSPEAQTRQFLDQVRDKATAMKDSILADLHLSNNKEDGS
jgi:hypothetical protein